MLLQPDIDEKMLTVGYDQQTKDELKRFLTKETLALGDYMREQLLLEYDEINPIYREMNGIDLESITNYFPATFLNDKVGTEIPDITQHPFELQGMLKTGALRQRVQHGLSIRTNVSAFQSYLSHKQKMSHYLAYAEGARDFFAVFNNRDVKRTLENQLGRDTVKEFNEHATQVMNGGNMNYSYSTFLEKAKALFIYKALTFNPGVFVKQLASFFAYLTHIPTTDFIKFSFGTLFTKQGWEDFTTLRDSDFVRNRVATGAPEEMMSLINNGRKKGWIKRAFKIGMLPTKLGDIFPVLTVGRAVYRATLNQSLADNKSLEEAKADAMEAFGIATEQTQQSSAWKDRTYWQREGSAWNLFTMFVTSQRQYMTEAARSIQKAINGGDKAEAAKKTFVYYVLLPATFKIVTNGMEKLIITER